MNPSNFFNLCQIVSSFYKEYEENTPYKNKLSETRFGAQQQEYPL